MANLTKRSTNIWATIKVLIIPFVLGVDFLGLSTKCKSTFNTNVWNYKVKLFTPIQYE